MIETICIATYILCFLLGWKKNKVILNPLTIFSAIWLVVVLCAFTHGKLNRPQVETIQMLIIGTLALCAGYIIAHNSRRRTYKLNNIIITGDGSKYALRYNLICILCIICILAYFYNLVLLTKIVGSGNLGLIKLYLQSNENGRSSWLNAFYFLLVDPLSVAIPICAIADLIFGEKNRKLLILAITLTVEKTIANTTRSTLGIFIVYFVMGSLMYMKINGYDVRLKYFFKKRRRQIFVSCFIAMIAFVYMTIARGSDVLDNLWTDFALPTSLFEYWKKVVDDQNIYGYGLASLNGFIYPIFYFFKNIFNIPIPEYIETIHTLTNDTESFVWASNTVTANAYVSIYWYFYLDFRLFGIIVGLFLVGYFSEKYYRDTMYYKSAKNFAIYCFFIHMLIFSIVRMPFTIVSSALGYVFVTAVLYKRRT